MILTEFNSLVRLYYWKWYTYWLYNDETTEYIYNQDINYSFQDLFDFYNIQKDIYIMNLEKKIININQFTANNIFWKDCIKEICQEKIKNREETSHFINILKWFKNDEDITQEHIQQAKQVNIEEIIQWYWIQIKNKFCKCPFHEWDNTGSLKIYNNNNKFYCFGCWTWWDVIEFVRRYENIEFYNAIKKLIKL